MRICNIEIKNQKLTLFSFLLMIYGINKSSAHKVCREISFAENTRLFELKDKGLTDVLITKKLQQAFKNLELLTGSDLRFFQENSLKRFKIVNHYRWKRIAMGLPINSNAARHRSRRSYQKMSLKKLVKNIV